MSDSETTKRHRLVWIPEDEPGIEDVRDHI